ncbi:MAG: WD40/YVTN/BNR-like repeat-containing protein [Chlorobiota bacterium]
MKTTLLTFLFILTFSTSSAEKQIELTPIVLPYDSLNIDEVYGYGATIIARSGNSIYHSTDDGASWDIALESSTKLNQLYSKDPHTVFAIGDSGLVYRTFDYGATWFDVSHETNLSMNKMAAKDHSEYFVVTKHTIGYFKKDMFSEYKAISNYSYKTIFSLKYAKTGYWYCTDFYKYCEYDDLVRETYNEFWLPYYQFTGEVLHSFKHDEYRVPEDKFDRYISYNFNIFPTEYGILFTGNSPDVHSAGISFGRLFSLYEHYGDAGGMMIKGDTINHIDLTNDTLNVITKHGLWVWMHYTEIEEDFVSPDEVEYSELGTPNINHVFQTYDNQYYLACDSSRVYKAKFVSIPTSINQENEKSISIRGNSVVLENGYELINAYNYLGQQIIYKQIDEKTIELEKGMYILKFAKSNKCLIKKMIIE